MIKLRLYLPKDSIKKVKREVTCWEKRSVTHITEREYLKNTHRLIRKKRNNTTEK